MYILKNSFAKINITLRVTGVRDDGYHNICSLFFRLNASETLRISASDKNFDTVDSEGIPIEGENIIAKALRTARGHGLKITFFNISVYKNIPPGMGLGGGSGNAGAVLDFAGAELPLDAVSKIGADVPFFYKNCEAAIVRGIGDKITPVDKPNLSTALIIPKWNSLTGSAYKSLDAYWGARGGYPLSDEGAEDELDRIYSLLASGKFAGLLPNDFAPKLIEDNELYDEFFKAFGDAGAVAWGITGSGASMFALYYDRKTVSPLLDKLQAYGEFIDRIILT